jgi:putative flavoprotein involved in K+ transport
MLPVAQIAPTSPRMNFDVDWPRSPVAPVVVVGGGQSGLAAARVLRELGMPALILEASDRLAGSWPRYYDSLRAFSPVEFNSMPGMPFPGPPGRYPTRDEVANYLDRYAAELDAEIQTNLVQRAAVARR